jgi:hypothetical protein
MRKFTFVVELPDEVFPIEKACQQVLRDERPGELIYAYVGDAVADLRHILANSGTAEGLDRAVTRVANRWWG